MATGITTDAVMFFSDGEVVKEMLYPEFEAILDHVVGIEEFSGMTMPAAFVRINAALQVRAVVLFLIDFDDGGYVDRSWNIPLSHLAENAGKGPDLGGGPIRLSCRSQCSISWHQRSLWDPDLHSGNRTLKQIAAAAARNRLGLTVLDDAEESVDTSVPMLRPDADESLDKRALEKGIQQRLAKKFQQELKARVENLREEHSLRVATMKAEAQEHLEKLQRLYRDELAKSKAALTTAKQLFAEEKHKTLVFKQQLEEQAAEFQKTRKAYQLQLQQGQSVSDEAIKQLETQFEMEARAKIEQATGELKEMLDMREVELFYRDEQVGRLNAEISELRMEKQRLMDSGNDKLLQRMIDSGISFVAYQPGVDPLTVPLRDISQYLESPVDYVAEKCTVDGDLYRQWIAHYRQPVCQHRGDDTDICGEALARVEKPSRFIAGESDRCARHNRAASTLSSLMKSREIS